MPFIDGKRVSNVEYTSRGNLTQLHTSERGVNPGGSEEPGEDVVVGTTVVSADEAEAQDDAIDTESVASSELGDSDNDNDSEDEAPATAAEASADFVESQDEKSKAKSRKAKRA